MPPKTHPTAQSAPQNIESLALQAAPEIGRGIVSQSGIWGLLFVLLVIAQMAFAYFVIPSHLKDINDGHKAAWDACKAGIEDERKENRANLAAQRAADAANTDKMSVTMEALGQRIDRGFDRVRDRGAAGMKAEFGGTATAKIQPGG